MNAATSSTASTSTTETLPDLIQQLELHGWRGRLTGPEFRAVRGVLATLTRMVDGKSGQGEVAVHELARRAGYSGSWTRRSLRILETLALIEWHRGGVPFGASSGVTHPSVFRVDRGRLLVLRDIADSTGYDS